MLCDCTYSSTINMTITSLRLRFLMVPPFCGVKLSCDPTLLWDGQWYRILTPLGKQSGGSISRRNQCHATVSCEIRPCFTNMNTPNFINLIMKRWNFWLSQQNSSKFGARIVEYINKGFVHLSFSYNSIISNCTFFKAAIVYTFLHIIILFTMSSPMTFDGDCALETKKTTPPISKTSKPSKSLLTKFKTTSGFNKTSDFVLFVCTAGVFALFCFQALRSLDYDCTWKYRAAPGEWFYFKDGVKRFFMQLHLWSAIRMSSHVSFSNICWYL